MNDEILKITDLSIIYKGRYKDVHAVNNVNLSVRPRKHWVLSVRLGQERPRWHWGFWVCCPSGPDAFPTGVSSLMDEI